MKEQILFGMAPRADPSEFWVQNQETGIQKSLSWRNVHLRSEMLIFFKLFQSACIVWAATSLGNDAWQRRQQNRWKRSGRR
jgi:hypothetical protein